MLTLHCSFSICPCSSSGSPIFFIILGRIIPTLGISPIRRAPFLIGLRIRLWKLRMLRRGRRWRVRPTRRRELRVEVEGRVRRIGVRRWGIRGTRRRWRPLRRRRSRGSGLGRMVLELVREPRRWLLVKVVELVVGIRGGRWRWWWSHVTLRLLKGVHVVELFTSPV